MGTKRQSEFTKLAWYIAVMAIAFESYLGITYLLSDNAYERSFGSLCILEALFALCGLLAIDVLNDKPFRLKPKPNEFKKPDPKTPQRLMIILIVVFVIQILSRMPLSVKDYHLAGAIIMAGPSEELFFRGLLISIFIAMSSGTKKYRINEKREISVIEILGLIFSSVLFTLLHRNYYGNVRVMTGVFTLGFAFAFFYWYYRDLTALTLAHLILNVLTVVASIYGVNF